MSLRPALASADDRTLAGRAADGDVRAFEVLIRRHGPLLRAYARRILSATDEVDDVVQETFITAWQQLPTLDDRTQVKSWLVTIASRKSIDRVRARGRRREDNIDDHLAEAMSPDDAHGTVEARSRDEALSRALSALPEDQRRCWVLRELARYSYDDIARELELPVSTVRGLLARARKTLMAEMEVWR